jgi:small GTP-binding protein
MNKYARIKWYRFKVANKIRLLEGQELIDELVDTIEDIKKKKLDKMGVFKLLIDDLERLITETKRKPKSKSREYDPFYIPRSGDGRLALFGISNVGKSTLMNAITNTDVKTGDYLHTTRVANAGTLEYKNVKIQIVDLPGFLEFKEEWAISKQIVRVARTSDAILLVIDLTMDIKKQLEFLLEQLEKAKIYSNGTSLYKLGIIATKGDLQGSKNKFTFLKSITDLPIIPVSTKVENSLDNLKNELFNLLDIVRVYTKPYKSKVDKSKPFVLPKGATVEDVADKIHKDFLKNFKYAKIWGESVEFDGKHVGLDHELADSDIIEIYIER